MRLGWEFIYEFMKTSKTQTSEAPEGDLVLREMWRAKDKLSAARGHSIDRLFSKTRERQKESGHRVINLQNQASGGMKQANIELG